MLLQKIHYIMLFHYVIRANTLHNVITLCYYRKYITCFNLIYCVYMHLSFIRCIKEYILHNIITANWGL